MNGSSTIVYVVDDDAEVCQALECLLQSASYQACAFTSPRKFLACHDPCAPGCIILDLVMPDCGGLELQATLAASGCARPIIFLSGNASIEASVAAVRAGATDFLVKPIEDHKLFSAVDAALVIDLENRRTAVYHEAIAHRIDSLTRRELEVLKHVISGRLNKQIAAEIGTVEKTVKVHRARAMHKLGARSVAELVQIANSAGITGRDRDTGEYLQPWPLRTGSSPIRAR